MNNNLLKKYLTEASITFGYDPNVLAGDDDYPTGNIIMGDKFIKAPYYNRLTSFNFKWVPDESDWKWDDFGACRGQESTNVYHDTLKDKKIMDRGNLTDKIFRHMKKNTRPKPIPKELRALGNNIFPDTDAWGKSTKYQALVGDIEEPSQKETEKNIKNTEKSVGKHIEEDIIYKLNSKIQSLE
jgi:hypothetical protein